MLKKHKSVLCLDTDSIINERFEVDDIYDLGLFFRDRLEPHMRVLASILYVKNTAIEFAEELRNRLENRIAKNDLPWCADQEEVWLTYKNTHQKYRTKAFGPDFINWQGEPALIWTGKGGSKTNNRLFVDAVARYSV
jgi:hypothetical protein